MRSEETGAWVQVIPKFTGVCFEREFCFSVSFGRWHQPPGGDQVKYVQSFNRCHRSQVSDSLVSVNAVITDHSYWYKKPSCWFAFLLGSPTVLHHYCVLLGSRLDISGHVASSVMWPFGIGHFLSVVLWNHAYISNDFRDIQWWMWHNDWHDLKRPLYKVQGHSFGTNRFLI